MISFRLSERYQGQAIILATPFRGVVGIVECTVTGCEHRLVLTVENGCADPMRTADVIDEFLRTHLCSGLH